MKKKIIIGAFLLLIAITAIYIIIAAVDSYNYDMDSANGVDIFEGLGAALIMIVGAFLIFYELDLFYTVYYFFLKPKSVAKSILNIFANVALLAIAFTDSIAHFLFKCGLHIFAEEIIVSLALICIYCVLRLVCALIPIKNGQ